MGVVYAAFDRELERPCALKVLNLAAGLDEAARLRFVREAKAAARLVHPHIAAVYDATPDAIAMQRIDGMTLGELGPDDPRLLAGLVRDAGLAIHFAHGEGVVHRDLKPQNLMVERREHGPHVYVMDFGLAKETAAESSLSVSGGVLGSPGYMAPEQASGGTRDVGPATDVYGLGATLFACLAGRAPFVGEDVVATLRMVEEEEAPRLRSLAGDRVDADLETIVAKCLEKEPARRYASALDLAGDLDRWLRGEPILARPPSLLYRLRRAVSRRQGAVVAASVAALLAVLLALPFVLQARARREAEEERRLLTERVFALYEDVRRGLDAAKNTRDTGFGHEQTAREILDQALAACLAFLAEDDVGQVHMLAGRCLTAQWRYAEALAHYDQAALDSVDEATLRAERGLVLAALFRQNTPLLGEEPSPELETWRRRGLEDLGLLSAEEPLLPTAEVLFAHGQHRWLAGDLEGAIGILREVVEMDMTHLEAHQSLSRLYLLLGRDQLGFRHSIVASDLMSGKRGTYVARANLTDETGARVDPGLELLPLKGMRELLVDFHLMLQVDPDTANTYAMQGQVLARKGMRALERGDLVEARESLQGAAHEFEATLTLRPGYAPAHVNRGVLRVQLARLEADEGRTRESAVLLDGAQADYDAAVAIDPELVAAWFDRALLHQHRERLARLSLDGLRATRHRQLAERDVREALVLVQEGHPFEQRIQRLGFELE